LCLYRSANLFLLWLDDLDPGDFKESGASGKGASGKGASVEEEVDLPPEFDESPPHSLECLSNKSSSSANSHHSSDEAEESVKEMETQLSTLTTASVSSSVVLDDEDFFILKPCQEGNATTVTSLVKCQVKHIYFFITNC